MSANLLLSYFRKCSVVIFLLLGSQYAFSQEKISFDDGWHITTIELTKDRVHRQHIGKNWNDQFSTEKVDISGNAMPANLSLATALAPVKGNMWKDVVLPNTAFPVPLVVKHPREGIVFYRKSFVIPDSCKGKIITLEFGAAMQIAWIWVNGKFVMRHLGGYLPFVLDLTHIIKYGKPNTIVVRLDNHANPQVPPGKPVNHLDFLYYSGLYRNAWLEIHNPLRITNPNLINRVAGGGVFVSYPFVSKIKALVNIKTNVENEFTENKQFALCQQLYNSKGKLIASTNDNNLQLTTGKDNEYVQQLMVAHPALWSPDFPNLYKLHTKVISKGEIVDEKVTTIGIRSIHIDAQHGLLLNGKPVRLEGSNRHMSYPWIGNALSKNANYRDAILIKNAGMNCIRLTQYPQDPSFYDACDSLGIMLLDAVPGFQFFNKSKEFTNNAFSDIRQMIRRDRNHPSIILWEVSLNEAYPPASFRCEQVEVAKSEWGGAPNFYTSGDSYFTKACYDVPYDDWSDNIEARNNTTYPNNPYLIREYGDYEFGGGLSTSRQSRGNGEDGLLQQAWNLQWEHNRNRQMYPRCIGDLTWAFFDGVSGDLAGIKSWGMADIKRIPKFSYYFFQSQKRIHAKPMCYIANYWDGKDTSNKIIVYSNCEEVALYLNGKKIADQHPDDGPDRPYGTALDKGGHPFDGGNVKGLSSPPFTFKNIRFVSGELNAVAYNKAHEAVASYTAYTPSAAIKIHLTAATHGIPLKADGSDAIFIYAEILDSKGHPVPDDTSNVVFLVSGPAKIVSPVKTAAEAGIATVLLQSDIRPGNIKITAYAKGLKSDTIEIKSNN